MSTTYPSSIQGFTNPSPTDRLNSPSHSGLHTSENDTLGALMTKVGVDNSGDTSSLDYIIKNSASDGGGHVQSANKGGTGQTSYTKGDLLVATSTSVLAKMAVTSVNGAVLTADSTSPTGMSWTSGTTTPVNIQSFISAGAFVWQKPANARSVAVFLVGAGGSGGGSSGTTGSGAGAGALANMVYNASQLESSVAGVIGAAGAGVSGGVDGVVGGPTTFNRNSILAGGGQPGIANGGAGGAGGSILASTAIFGASGGAGATQGGGGAPGGGNAVTTTGGTPGSYDSVLGRGASKDSVAGIYGAGGSGSTNGLTSGSGTGGFARIITFV